MLRILRSSLLLLGATFAVCAVAYPLAMLGLARVLFPSESAGALIAGADGKPVGSRHIAQAFTKDEYFQPRPSAAGYNAAAAGGSNWGANSPKLRFRVTRQLGSSVRYTDGKPVGPDIETWFATEDRLAAWASANPIAASEWVKSGDDTKKIVVDWCKDHPDVVDRWKADNPKAKEPPDIEAAPDAVAVQFFASFAAANPKTFPSLTDGKIAAVTTGSDLQGVFFEAWLQAHPGAKLEQVPADAVTASGAGLDPHITLRNARWQLDRVAAKRAGTADLGAVKTRIDQILKEKAFAPLRGLAGEPLVNVLEANLELDRLVPVPPAAP